MMDGACRASVNQTLGAGQVSAGPRVHVWLDSLVGMGRDTRFGL